MRRWFHFGFAARVSLLFVGSLVAIQGLMVMGYFIQRANDVDTRFRLPLPDQVAATAELLEKGSPKERKLVLRALNSAQYRAKLTAVNPAPQPATWRELPLAERLLKRYLNVLGKREVLAYLQTEDGRLASSVLPSSYVTVIVKLNTGEYLVIQASGPFSSLFGFPPGYWAGVFGFGVAILAFLIIRREARPLRELAFAADHLDLTEPNPIPDRRQSAPEIRAVISAFNRMQERICGLIKSRMEMVGGFSHDLRTYATRLKLRAELIADEGERDRAIRDIDDMICLVDDTLLAIRDQPSELRRELVDIGELVEDEIGHHQQVGARVSFALKTGSLKALALGNGTALRRVFSNLIDNAISYGGETRAIVDGDATHIRVLIEDSGPGIPPELRARVTQPFVRLEGSRNRKTGGAGLGLAIAKNITEAHGGVLLIGEAPGGGARLTVELPRFVPAFAFAPKSVRL